MLTKWNPRSRSFNYFLLTQDFFCGNLLKFTKVFFYTYHIKFILIEEARPHLEEI